MGIVRWLASGQEKICFKLSLASNVEVDIKPLLFNSDVSYIEPESKVVVLVDEDEEGLVEEESE